jgi:hypothetical protein
MATWSGPATLPTGTATRYNSAAPEQATGTSRPTTSTLRSPTATPILSSKYRPIWLPLLHRQHGVSGNSRSSTQSALTTAEIVQPYKPMDACSAAETLPCNREHACCLRTNSKWPPNSPIPLSLTYRDGLSLNPKEPSRPTFVSPQPSLEAQVSWEQALQPQECIDSIISFRFNFGAHTTLRFKA